MKKVIIGAFVGAIIFFVYETAVWMGGFHSDFSTYSPNQAPIMQTLSEQLHENGAYMMPSVDPTSPNARQLEEKLMTESVGKPWAMVFYHTKMIGMEASYMIKGFLYTLLACLITMLVLYSGRFNTFGKRFAVAMSFSLFALLQCTLAQMNWWDFPWNFIKATVFDLIFGWALCALWFAWYLKEKTIDE